MPCHIHCSSLCHVKSHDTCCAYATSFQKCHLINFHSQLLHLSFSRVIFYILTTIYVYCSGGVASPSSRSLGSMCTCRPAERRVIFMFSRRADRSADHWAILPKRSDSVSLQTTLCFKIYFSYELVYLQNAATVTSAAACPSSQTTRHRRRKRRARRRSRPATRALCPFLSRGLSPWALRASPSRPRA